MVVFMMVFVWRSRGRVVLYDIPQENVATFHLGSSK
jgi:hypothetical protein